MSREKIIENCDKITEFSLYIAAFYIPVSNALIESSIGLAIAAWLVKKVAIRSSLRRLFYPNILSLPILAYFLICLNSSIFSSNRAISFNHLFFKTTEYLLLFFIVVEVAGRRFLRNILIVLVISLGLIGIDGLFQYFANFDFFRGRAFVVAGRITGPFTSANDFACYLVSLFPLVASLAFLKFKKLWVRRALIFISVSLFICIILTASRSAWVALLLAIPVTLLLRNKKLFLFLLLLVMCVFIFFPFIPDMPRSRIESLFHYKKTVFIGDRPFLLYTGLNMVVDKPVLGQGLGTFMFNFNKFKYCPLGGYPGSEGISYAHNCFLQMAAETGVLGLSSFLIIISLLFIYSFILLFKLKGSVYFFVLSGLLIGIFTYLVSSFFDTNLYSLPLAVLFWFMVGLAAGVIKIIEQEKGPAFL